LIKGQKPHPSVWLKVKPKQVIPGTASSIVDINVLLSVGVCRERRDDEPIAK